MRFVYFARVSQSGLYCSTVIYSSIWHAGKTYGTIEVTRWWSPIVIGRSGIVSQQLLTGTNEFVFPLVFFVFSLFVGTGLYVTEMLPKMYIYLFSAGRLLSSVALLWNRSWCVMGVLPKNKAFFVLLSWPLLASVTPPPSRSKSTSKSELKSKPCEIRGDWLFPRYSVKTSKVAAAIIAKTYKVKSDTSAVYGTFDLWKYQPTKDVREGWEGEVGGEAKLNGWRVDRRNGVECT